MTQDIQDPTERERALSKLTFVRVPNLINLLENLKDEKHRLRYVEGRFFFPFIVILMGVKMSKIRSHRLALK